MTKAGPARFSFRRVDSGNIEELADGMSRVHRSARAEWRDADYWRWCYIDNSAGGSGCVVALQGGEVVGKLGNVHVRFAVQGRRVTAGLLEDLAVVESARSWACFRGLVGGCLRELAADGLAFGYGFVVAGASGPPEAIGATNLGRVPMWTGLINLPRALRGRGMPGVLAALGWIAQPAVGLRRRDAPTGLDLRPLDSFGPDFDDLWADVEKTHAVAAMRDADYLSWRYSRCPVRSYEQLAAYRGRRLDGVAVFRAVRGKHKAYLLELMARGDDPEVLCALATGVARTLKERDVGLLTASFPRGTAEAAALRRLGFRAWATPIWHIDLLVTGPEGAPQGVAPDPANWYLSLGDWLAH